LADAPPHVRRQPLGGALDIEQAADAVERLLGERQSGEVKLMEFAPHVRPAGDFSDATLVKRAEPGPWVRSLAGPRTGAAVGM
jgi:hypothetical protein